MRLAPAVAGFGDAVFVSARSALGAPETTNCTEAECCKAPLVVASVREYIPAGVAAVVLIVSVADFADRSLMKITTGLKLTVASFDNPLRLR